MDTGFPIGGGAISWGVPTYEFAGFSQKLHEIKKILVGGGRAGGAPLDPPLGIYWYIFKHISKEFRVMLRILLNLSPLEVVQKCCQLCVLRENLDAYHSVCCDNDSNPIGTCTMWDTIYDVKLSTGSRDFLP